MISKICISPIQESGDSWRLHFCSIHTVILVVTAVMCLLLSSCARKSDESAPVIFYPNPPEQPRLQFLTVISSEDDLKVKQSSFQNYLLGPDIDIADIGRPYDISSSAGKLYIIDRAINEILTVDLNTGEFDMLSDIRRGALATPSGIWVTPDDVKYIADLERRQIVVFDADDSFVRAYGDGQIFEKPVDVAIYQNSIYVCDMKKNAVLVLDKVSGRLLRQVGEIGAGEGQLYKPTHITVDENGNLFVNDAFNYRVQQFDADGNFVKTYGFHGDLIGAMARSKGVTIDREGHLYVADAAFERVQIFDSNAQLLLFFGGPGIGPGNMYLPAGIHIDYENIAYFQRFADKDFKLKYILYVCNMSGPNRINVYGFGDWLGE
ncbi:6-bladed beta-propeller [Desulfosediminicola flagellatus]|uniref:6-bladed beta-propeller n=1 Tax=Desulfosediminicola flagellatus TaxID=2569541 RepID=UPI0010AD8F55|nr:6-bladed beta-propeller [Desulfosediminicola flagellatus]